MERGESAKARFFTIGPVVQRPSIRPCQGRDRRFESGRDRRLALPTSMEFGSDHFHFRHELVVGIQRERVDLRCRSSTLRAVSPRLALMIGGIAAIVFGLGLLVFPTSMLASFGLDVTEEAKVLSRDVGATLIGLGVINWMARNATGEPLRALLVGNVVVQALELLVNGYAIVSGALPPQAASGLLIHLVLGGEFVLAMRSTYTPT